MKRCLMVTGGPLDLSFGRRFLLGRTYDLVIAVDAGLAACEALGLCPDLLVGDFDTLGRERLLEYQERSGVRADVHQPEKDETDTELARSRALTLGCDRLVFLGATGGRLDHMLGNLHALYACLEKGIDASLVDAQNRIYLLDQGKSFYRKNLWGKYVSFLPYTEEVTGITLTGFRYPLQDKTIRRGQEVGLCISNELAEDRAVLEFREGILICVESSD